MKKQTRAATPNYYLLYDTLHQTRHRKKTRQILPPRATDYHCRKKQLQPTKGCGRVATLEIDPIFKATRSNRDMTKTLLCKAPIKKLGACMRRGILNWFEYRTFTYAASRAVIGCDLRKDLRNASLRTFFKVLFYSEPFDSLTRFEL